MSVKKLGVGDELQSDSIISLLKSNKSKKTKPQADYINDEQLVAEERIEIGLGKAINAELNEELLRAERREKVEKLKELVASGKYNPPSLEVANAVHQEIVFDILTQDPDSKSDDTEQELI